VVRLEVLLERGRLGERGVRVGPGIAAVPALAATLDVFRAQRRIAIRTIAARRPLGALAARRPLPAAPRLLRSRRARSALMTPGAIPPPLPLTPFRAVGPAAGGRGGRGRGSGRPRRGRCLAVGADGGFSDGRSRNELRPRLALGATLARPTFMARLARMLVATDRPPNLDEFLGRKFRLGRRLRGRLR